VGLRAGQDGCGKSRPHRDSITGQERDGRVLQTVYVLKRYTGTDDCKYRYIRGRGSCVCRIKQGRKARALWGIS